MSCPICLSPGVCRCAENSSAGSTQPDESVSVADHAEQYEPTEERFAASLDGHASPCAPGAGCKGEEGETSVPQQQARPKPGEQVSSIDTREPLPFADYEVSGHAERLAQLRPARRAIVLGEPNTAERSLETGEWKQEVLSRVTRYRARRRPGVERLRSLDLNFDTVTPFPARPLPVDKTPEAAAAPVEEPEQATEPPEQAVSDGTAVPEWINEASADLEQQAAMAMQVDVFGIQRCWPNAAPRNPNPFRNRKTDAADVPIQQSESKVEPQQQPEDPIVPATPDIVAQDFVESLEIPGAQLNAEIISKLAEAIRAAERREGGTLIEPPAEAVAMPAEELADPPAGLPHVFEEEEVWRAEQLMEHVAPTVQIAPPMATVDLLPTPAEANTNAEAWFVPIAPLRLRAAMQAIDFGVSVSGCLVFFVVLMWFGALPMGKPLAFMLALMIGFFWSLYQYLLLVNAGTTVGMVLTGLQLTGFESREVSRSRCRARALAMAVSTLALGVGFAWALLDLDRLSWHDRASGTFLTRRTQ